MKTEISQDNHLAAQSEHASLKREPADKSFLLRQQKQRAMKMEECGIPECKMSKVVFQHEMKKCAQREGKCWTAQAIILVIVTAFCLTILWILPSIIWRQAARNTTQYLEKRTNDDSIGLSYDPTNTHLFEGFPGKSRLNAILDTFLLEEDYNFKKLDPRRYILFERRANRTDAVTICSSQHASLVNVESIEEDEFLDRFLSREANMLIQSRRTSQPDLGQTIKIWTSGYINVSSDSPAVISWGGFLPETSLDHLPVQLKRTEKKDMSYMQTTRNGEKITMTEYTNFCNATQTLIDLTLAKEERTKKPVIMDVIKDFRENQANPGCWLLSRRTKNAYDENFILCEDAERKANNRYDANLNFVGQRYSDVSDMYYKFFSNKEPLIEAKRICEDESSHLLTFNSETDERDFDNKLWNHRQYIFSNTNFTNRNESIRLFTSGWFWLSSVNSNDSHWGRHNPLATNETMTYENFCPEEKNKARDLFMQDNSNQLFVVLKDFTGRLIDKEAFKEQRSCWRLESYRRAKEMDFENYFGCQTRKVSMVTRIHK